MKRPSLGASRLRRSSWSWRSDRSRTADCLFALIGCGGSQVALTPEEPPSPETSSAATYPEADDARFTVAIAKLDGDADDEVRGGVTHVLAGVARRSRHRIQVLRYPVTVELGDSADVELQEAVGHRNAQHHLAEGGADLLLWGRVREFHGEVLPELFWTVAGGDRHLGDSDFGLEGAKLTERLLEDYREALELVLLSQATMLGGAETSWALPEVRALRARLLAFLETEAFGGWEADEQVAALRIAGDSSRLIGLQAGESRLLEEAGGLYEQALRLVGRAEAPLKWASLQNRLGRALFRLGEWESGTARLEESVNAFYAALDEYTRSAYPSIGQRRRPTSATRLCASASASPGLTASRKPSGPTELRSWSPHASASRSAGR